MVFHLTFDLVGLAFFGNEQDRDLALGIEVLLSLGKVVIGNDNPIVITQSNTGCIDAVGHTLTINGGQYDGTISLIPSLFQYITHYKSPFY